eukprot:4164053-Ditylum_brightwellii.AAC.1
MANNHQNNATLPLTAKKVGIISGTSCKGAQSSSIDYSGCIDFIRRANRSMEKRYITPMRRDGGTRIRKDWSAKGGVILDRTVSSKGSCPNRLDLDGLELTKCPLLEREE